VSETRLSRAGLLHANAVMDRPPIGVIRPSAEETAYGLRAIMACPTRAESPPLRKAF